MLSGASGPGNLETRSVGLLADFLAALAITQAGVVEAGHAPAFEMSKTWSMWQPPPSFQSSVS